MAEVVDGLIKKTESKVVAATAGTISGGVVATFAIYLIGVLVFGADATADSGASAVGAVPAPVIGFVGFALTALGSYLGGYIAPHTSRTVIELPPAPADSHAVGSLADPGEPAPATADETEVAFGDDDTV